MELIIKRIVDSKSLKEIEVRYYVDGKEIDREQCYNLYEVSDDNGFSHIDCNELLFTGENEGTLYSEFPSSSSCSERCYSPEDNSRLIAKEIREAGSLEEAVQILENEFSCLKEDAFYEGQIEAAMEMLKLFSPKNVKN